MTRGSVQARDISQSVIVTGDRNAVTLTFGDSGIVLPLRRRQFRPADRRLDRAMEDAVEVTAKPAPDKAKCAKAAGDFAENAEKIVPRLVALGSWLGSAGRAVLNVLGVAI